MSNNGNTPASPFTAKPEYQYQDAGLTKREHLAGIAMQSIISSEYISDFMVDGKGTNTSINGYEAIAIEACKYADALLKELDK